jgi:hypothetical protein
VVVIFADGTYWFRLIRSGGTITMKYSSDGVNYLTALTATLADPLDPYNELLLDGITHSSAGSFTDYDFVQISSVPEPGGLILMTLALIGVGLKRFRSFTRTQSSSELH